MSTPAPILAGLRPPGPAKPGITKSFSSGDDLESPLVRKNFAGMLSFFALCALCMTNINFITSAMLGKEQVFSVLYLLACLVILFSFGFKVGQAIGAPGWFWMFGVGIFLAISTRCGFGIDTAYFLSPQSNFYRILIAQMITMCAALGARYMILRGQSQLMLRILFGFMVGAASTILITKFVPQILVFIGAPRQDRSGGFFEDPNRAGQAVCIAAAVGFAALVNETKKWQYPMYAGMAMLIPCLFLTFSRSAIVFLALLMAMQFFISPIFKRKETIIAMLVIGSLMPVGIFVVLAQRASVVDQRSAANVKVKKERMQGLFELLQGKFTERNTGYRTRVGAVGLQYFVDNPVIGAGFRKLVRMPEIGLGCHNTFIRVLGEAGLFAGLTFIGAVFLVAACGWFSPRPEVKCLAIGYMAMYACGCMVSHSMLTNRLTNVMLGIVLGGLSAALTSRKASDRQKRQELRMAIHQQQQRAAMMQVPQAAAVQSIPVHRSR